MFPLFLCVLSLGNDNAENWIFSLTTTVELKTIVNLKSENHMGIFENIGCADGAKVKFMCIE